MTLAQASVSASVISSTTARSPRRCSSACRHSPRTNGTLRLSTGRRTVKAMSTPGFPSPSGASSLRWSPVDHDEGIDPLLFEIERTTVLGRPALRVRGELDLATPPQLAEAVDAVLATAPRSMVLDLTDTSFMDSSGARQLAWSARRSTRGGVWLQVVCPRGNRSVRLVIDLLELQALVPIVEAATLTEGEVGP